jgi:hypothetical protein
MHDIRFQPPPAGWSRLRALLLTMMLAVPLLAAAGGCSAIRAKCTGMHYALAFYPLADVSTPPEQRTITVNAPDGKPVRILSGGFLSSRDITAIDLVRDGETITALCVHMPRTARYRWMQMQQQMKGGSFAVVADSCLCVGVFRATPEMFPEECIVMLPGPWDPDVAASLSRYAPTNYTLFHE